MSIPGDLYEVRAVHPEGVISTLATGGLQDAMTNFAYYAERPNVAKAASVTAWKYVSETERRAKVVAFFERPS